MPDPIEIMARASYEREISPYGSPWSHIDEGSRRAFLADMRAALSALHEAGFVIVPKEPTEQMLSAAPASYSASFQRIWPSICGDIYGAMIAAAREGQ